MTTSASPVDPSLEARALAGQQRYELRALLGEGASGRVYRAFDRVMSREVALKTLKRVAPEEIYRLKREFRTLVDVAHPQLIRLYDLVASAEHCFFTMELIDGPSFLEWVWQGERPRPDAAVSPATVERLREGIGQLALGVDALHQRGLLHRDIKPSNILVTPDGRVVVTDVGLVSTLEPPPLERSGAGAVVGTLAYMAPEQSWGNALSLAPAADWYSVGVILYEALAGRLPYKTTDVRLLAEKRGALAVPPDPPPGSPPDLVELARELLDANPTRRPGFEEVLDRLGGQSRASAAHSGRRGFFGRKRELDWLRRLQEVAQSKTGAAAFCQVRGPAGVGKTALVEHFVARLERAGPTVVLRGRCRTREYLLFKALDGVVDDLSRHLASQSASELAEIIPDDVGALVHVFPILGRIEALAPFSQTAAGANDSRLRHRAFVALREVLRRIAGGSGLVVWIDDLHWADSDSLVFLRLLQGPTNIPGLLCLYAFRSGDHVDRRAYTLLSSASAGCVLERFELGPLDAGDVRLLVRDLAPAASEEQTLAIVRATAGVPLLVHAYCGPLFPAWLGRPGPPPTFEELVALCHEGLPEATRDVVRVVCLAGYAVEQRLLVALHADAETRLTRLQELTLVRQVVEHDRVRWEPTHDVLREAVARRMTADDRTAMHARVALALATLSDPDPQDLLEHLLAGGQTQQAIDQAVAAAENADRRAAFDTSAGLYKRILEIGVPTEQQWRTRAALGMALLHAGLAREGAGQLTHAADLLERARPGDLDVVGLRATAGERLLFSGFSADGLDLMRNALGSLDAPYAKSSAGGLLRGAMHMPRAAWQRRRWAARTRQGSEAPPILSPLDALRLQVLWSAGFAIAWNDPMRAVELHVRHSTLAYAKGHPGHIARSLSVQAAILAMRGGAARQKKAVERQSEAERLANRSGDPSVRTFVALYWGVLEFFLGHWRSAVRRGEKTVDLCLTSGAGIVPEMGLGQWICLAARAYLGEIAEIRSKLPEYLMTAEARQDRRSMAIFRLGWINVVWLCADEPDEAASEAASAFAPFSNAKFDNIHYLHLIAATNASLYRGRATEAWRRVRASWRALAGSFLLRMVTVHCEMHDVLGRAALAHANEDPTSPRTAGLLRRLRACEKDLSANTLPSAQPLAAVLRAGLASLEGRRSLVVSELEQALIGFERLEMTMHGAACRLRLAPLVGGGRGDELERAAHASFESHGVVRPARLADALVPLLR